MDYPGKLIRKTPLVPTQTSASGVWTMTEAMDAVKANIWPVAGTPLPMQQSLRFRRSASAYLNRTFGSPTNGTTWTFSYWAKLGIIGRCNHFAPNLSTNEGSISIESDYTLYVNARVGTPGGAGTNYFVSTSQVFRDPSSWYHIVVALDTTQATASNRVKIYVNGSQVTALANANYPPQNSTPIMGSAVSHAIGRVGESGYEYYYDGLFGEMNYVDGQALTPSSFGRTDPITGVWQAIPYTGTFGTNGFYLPFKNPSNVGADYSGNANNWTANNFSTTPTYNYTSYTSGSGTYTVPAGVDTIQYLVVGGGGGGGGGNLDGGGGGGGMLTGTLSVTAGQTFAYSVGAGGASDTAGSNSTFGPFTAYGGGTGTRNASPAGSQNGGSGGGGYYTETPGTGVAGQGFAGGSGGVSGSETSGGGGGAGSVGGNAPSTSVGGAGGTGRAWINGTYYAGGGGGGAFNGTGGAGGTGGGGKANNGNANGSPGTANTGGGGGGASYASPGGASGGAGGSGIVIVAYQTSASTYDVMADTPTQWLPASTLNGNANARGNYATFNPLIPVGATGTSTWALSDGNLSLSQTGGTQSTSYTPATIGFSSGKWYFEFTPTSANVNFQVGFVSGETGFRTDVTNPTVYVDYYSCSTSPVQGISNSSGSVSGTALQASNGDIIGVAIDYSTGTVYYYKNNTLMSTVSGMTFSGLTLYPYAGIGSYGRGNSTQSVNFGQRPFSYTPPSGYLALNTYNMSTPTILQGNTVMDATLYTGNGTGQSITNTASFKPDLVWTKARSSAYTNNLIDSVRGASISLVSNSTAAEDNGGGTYFVTAFNNNGFTVGIGTGSNNSGTTYVGWQWQAGQGTTSSNTNGSITSTVSVNATAGFSIVTYTGTGSNATVGHGLGVAPSMVIVKLRSVAGEDWRVYHSSVGSGSSLALNLTSAASAGTVWNNTSPTSSVFSIGTNSPVNTSGATIIAYCWAEIAGFSKFGSYTGNGSADGTFVYLGFRPKFLLTKNSSSGTSYWRIWDTSRSPYNEVINTLFPNVSNAEDIGGSGPIDILSNGFKIRTSATNDNGSGNTIIYMAFAENPFKNALAR